MCEDEINLLNAELQCENDEEKKKKKRENEREEALYRPWLLGVHLAELGLSMFTNVNTVSIG